jgi:hypothetical protein
MSAAKLFQVATEFKFEIGSALLGTKTLQGGVDRLQQSIDGAEIAFKRMSLTAAVSMGG